VAVNDDPIFVNTSHASPTMPHIKPFAAYGRLLFVLFLFTLPLVNPWVRGDGVGYYSYVRSALIDHDLRFENDFLAGNESFVQSRVDEHGHLRADQYTGTGYIQNHFSVGPAMLWAPVLIPVHAAVLLANRLGAHIPADGHSRPYLISMALATATYGFICLLLTFRVARKYFDSQWAFLATVAVWLSSSLPVYMYFNPSWSHALSAFAVALFLWYWDRTQLQRTVGQWVVLALIAGLMANVYYPNVFLLIFPGLESIHLMRAALDDSDRAGSSLRKPVLCWVIFVPIFLISLLPTFITRQIIYGNPFETGYPGMRTWNWASPVLFRVLFSSDHGMFSWTPILALATIGLFFLMKRNVLLGAGSLLTFLVFYYFIASYPDWDGLSSFGNRFFVSLTPIFILGLTALFNASSDWMGKASRAAVVAGVAVLLFTAWNLAFMFQWGTHMVPARGEISWAEMIDNQFVNVPLRLTHSLESYFLHRQDMMRHIEQEDLEQQKVQVKRND